MNLKISMFKVIRKLFRSFSKYEYKFIDKITYSTHLKERKKIILPKELLLENIESKLKKKSLNPKNLSIVICFHYRKKRIRYLKKICENIKTFKFKKKITILTNEINPHKVKLLNKIIIKIFKDSKIIIIKNIPEPNLLPWYCFNEIRKQQSDKTISHFLYLEDDILINEKNINYWIYLRNHIKKYKLIPGFLRYEKKNDLLFSADHQEKVILKNTPKFYISQKRSGLLNTKLPYHAACLMDRELLNEYVKNNSISIDYGFHHKILRNIYPVKELANIIIGYVNVPTGFHNRFLLPFININEIPSYCLVEHLDARFLRLKKSKFSRIQVKHLLI
jgi:hypothetical protein